MSSKLKLHARRRAQRFGDLDALLAEALKDRRRGEGAVKRLKGINQFVHEQYVNPLNWTDKGILLIIYVDEKTGAQTTVGTFQEKVHRTGARRLTRVSSDLPTRCCVEGCCNNTHNVEEYRDPYLIRGKIDTCPPVPKGDIFAQQAIRAYLQRTREQSLGEALGTSNLDAAKLLGQLKAMGVEKLR